MRFKILDRALMSGRKKRREDYYYQMGLEYCKKKNYKTCIEFFEKDIQFRESTFETYYQIGIALFCMHNYEKACEFFNKAWETKFAKLLKFKTQANTLRNINQHEKALEYYDKAKVTEHDFPSEFWKYRGDCLLNLEKHHEAIEDYDQFLQINQNDVEVIFKKAKCECLLGNKSACTELLKNASKINNMINKQIEDEPVFKNINFLNT